VAGATLYLVYGRRNAARVREGHAS
jgi:hypothetical protein